MAGFIQLIELQTSRFDEVEALVEQYRMTEAGHSTARRSTVTADRDKPNTYINIVEFDSYDSALANSKRPETGQFAEQLAKLCVAPPVFRNLDVRRTVDIS
jgi:quinol monooxygenase YgiN